MKVYITYDNDNGKDIDTEQQYARVAYPTHWCVSVSIEQLNDTILDFKDWLARHNLPTTDIGLSVGENKNFELFIVTEITPFILRNGTPKPQFLN